MNVIHRDLACRNVLVGENKTLKISDFGLSKEIDGVYASSSRTRLPLRWMAPEAIAHRLFSEKSDMCVNLAEFVYINIVENMAHH